MLLKRWFFGVYCALLVFPSVGISGQSIYTELKSVYNNFNENDESALPYVSRLILKAKQEKNFEELKQGFEDYSYYSSNKQMKFKYADSAVVAARKTGNNEITASAYLYKGSLYYFYYKNYTAALNEYLQAFDYSKNVKNAYLKYKIVYQMGLVKSYLGDYGAALKHFEECMTYFESKTKGKNSPNEIYNNSKGYLNSLHQAIACDRYLGNYKAADSLIQVGFNFIGRSKDFPDEKNYFLLSRGISDYHHKSYKTAIKDITKALPLLQKNDDIYWVSVSEFYIGKCLMNTEKENPAILQFKKVDSLFQKRQFFFPELTENYELLISYYRNRDEKSQELAYTQKLLKVHNLMSRDFPKLSSEIHKDYDDQILTDRQSKLENRGKWRLGSIIILVAVVILLSVVMRRHRQKIKEVKQRYVTLEKGLQRQTSMADSVFYDDIPHRSRSMISENVFTDIEKKLKDFEDQCGFKESGLTIDQLAKTLDTNKSYLSQYINDTKGMSFSKYLTTKRIDYITQLMYNDPKYLNLSIQGLADECGIASRSHFSNLFKEINGIRPADFIKRRMAS